MKFVGITGVIAKAKRFLSTSASVNENDVADKKKLAEILRTTLLRVSELEARMPPAGIEFEVATPSGGFQLRIAHNLNSPVRWWVTEWTRGVAQGAFPSTAPILIKSSQSDSNNLILYSYTVGRAVIRVEPASGAMEA